jgi:NAD-specific glutamate dehydrogenase
MLCYIYTQVSVVQAIEAARSKNSGQLKANMYDPMYRLTEQVMSFFIRNEQQPQPLKQPVTTKLIVAKVRAMCVCVLVCL